MRMTTYVCYKCYCSNHVRHNRHKIFLKVKGYLYARMKARHKQVAGVTCGNIPQHIQGTSNDKHVNTNDSWPKPWVHHAHDNKYVRRRNESTIFTTIGKILKAKSKTPTVRANKCLYFPCLSTSEMRAQFQWHHLLLESKDSFGFSNHNFNSILHRCGPLCPLTRILCPQRQ